MSLCLFGHALVSNRVQMLSACLLVLALVARLVTAFEDMNAKSILNEHLCRKVQTGRFDLINIKSMTFYYRDRSLVIFEGGKKLYIPIRDITPKGIKMNLNLMDWDKYELNDSVALAREQSVLSDEPIYAVYYLFWGDSKWPNNEYACEKYANSPVTRKGSCKPGTRYGAFIFTKDQIVSIDFFYKKPEPVVMLGETNIYPELAIVHDQVDMEKSAGFIIHQDVYDKSNDMIIYDMDIDYVSLRIKMHKIHQMDKKEIEKARFYFIEMNDKPDQLVLVKRSTKHSPPRKQLFAQVPRGFRHEGKLYLFDTVRGCVTVVHDFPVKLFPLNLNWSWDGVKNWFCNLFGYENDLQQYPDKIVLTRSNIPYEKFFDCPGKLSKGLDKSLKPDRCELSLNSKEDPDGFRAGAPRSTPLYQISNNVSIFSITMIIFVLLVVTAFVVIVVYFVFFRVKRAAVDISKIKDKLARKPSPNKRTSKKDTPKSPLGRKDKKTPTDGSSGSTNKTTQKTSLDGSSKMGQSEQRTVSETKSTSV